MPYGCYYRAQYLSYNTGSAKSTTKDGYYGICKKPAFADNSNQAVEVYADGTKDTGFCENVAETQPIWVADPCDTGNGNGLLATRFWFQRAKGMPGLCALMK